MESSTFKFEIVSRTGVQAKKIHWNLTPPLLYEEVIRRGEAMIAENGPLVIYTGKATGRSANDKFFVKEPSSQEHVWWGKNNKPFDPGKFETLKNRILDYFSQKELYGQDCFGGADPAYRFPVRVVTDSAWSSLFAYNMFIHAENVLPKDFLPEFTVLVASGFEADPEIDGTRSDVVVAIHLGQKLALIAGTRYAGEIKKTVFTVLNYLFPLQGVFPMHCAANIGEKDDSVLFFGLSGTGKTTLSADPKRRLIGDDEHGWSDRGVFNFEGGCYAKVIHLSAKDEPQIFGMTQRFGTILENVVIDPNTRKIDLNDETITENTRASYLLSQIENHEPSGMGDHPHNVIFLTADAFGVLPPISLLTPEQAMYYFLSGYTAKVAGTEKGIKEPQATFSTCFGGPFMVHHPMVYAELLKERIKKSDAHCWLVNTGWTGGQYGVGSRIKISYTRAMIETMLNGGLEKVAFIPDPVFGLLIPAECPGVPASVLQPRNTWPNVSEYDEQARKLAAMFVQNFVQFADAVPKEVLEAGPKI
ncbi:MAG: phosphoenolpyruvate carboxykinase (ATP) [Chloroflexi bacterium HGW-Chloroflexi-8]|nr:MAG: phosphoenolpyruvate carboxykinase (ATP) [Chloroflexi bacterium HGW-Chloroflexi-8]